MVSTTVMIALAFLTVSARTAPSQTSDTVMIQLAAVTDASNAAVSPTEYWQQMGGDIDGSSISSGYFGRAVSLSADGTRVAVGAPPYNGAGYASVYEYSNSAWVQMGGNLTGTMDPAPSWWYDKPRDPWNPTTGEGAGGSVSLSADGNRVVVGGSGYWGVDEDSGRVRIYDYVASAWVQTGVLEGAAYGEGLGCAVSLSADGTRLAVASRNRGGRSGNDRTGYVDVYDYLPSNSSWVQVGDTIVGEAPSDRAGQSHGQISLSADGTRVAIGATNNRPTDSIQYGAGHVRIFEYSSSSSSWEQMGADLDGTSNNHMCGTAVSLSSDGSRVAYSCPRDDDDIPSNAYDEGAIRVFGWTGSSWQQVGATVFGHRGHMQYGQSVSLSANGDRLAIGATKCCSPYGGSKGAVRMYELNSTSSWVECSSYVEGESSNDEAGRSVSLSADGARLAIGAPKNDAAQLDSGQVRVFQWISPTPPPTPTPTASPTPASLSANGVSAKGDPHLTNMYGQRFDVLREGMYVFAHVPRLAQPMDTLLKIEADVQRLGDTCADLYIQSVNVTGAWADAGDGKKGIRYDVGMKKQTTGWRSFHEIKVKVAKGKTKTGAVYLNVYVKNLEKVHHDVGGLLGIDDHTLASMAPKHCRKFMDI